MAFHWQTFRTRALTAVIFAAVMLVGLLWNQWSFFLLFSVIHFGCWWEYLALVEKIQAIRFHPYVKLGFMLIGYGLFLWMCGNIFQVNSYYIRQNLPLPISVAGFVLLWIGIFQKMQIRLRAFGAAAAGIFYISLSWGLVMDMVSIHQIKFNGEGVIMKRIYEVPVMIIIAIWINDTMAYIVGSLIGKRPLSNISPKKTWEGTIGGVLLSVAVIGLIAYFFIDPQVILFMLISAIAAITGTVGDLLESKLKRMANVKDSGKIMPGHGGFLDRFDSLLIAVPCVWLFLRQLANLAI
jgi:phosphatidate cytidylyltransferase